MIAPQAQPLSRRRFARWMGLGAAWAALDPLRAEAPADASPRPDLGETVRLSANESPYGPCPGALAAMAAAGALAWRYPDEHAEPLLAALSRLHRVPGDHLLLGNGSSELLKLAAAAFTGAGRPAVLAEPTFEALARHARVAGGEVARVPLTADHRHDLARMAATTPAPGLLYVCNPNNPTGTITPASEIRELLAGVSASTTVLVDEAYHHYAASPLYESAAPLVGAHPNLIVTRTFSKLHGMAGLRCGYAVAQPHLIERLAQQQPWDSLNVVALAAAAASLADGGHEARVRRLNREAREATRGELAALGYGTLPSETNFFMIDLGRDAGAVREALRARRVEVGRVFPALPGFLRVTVGTSEQMTAFLEAFRLTMA